MTRNDPPQPNLDRRQNLAWGMLAIVLALGGANGGVRAIITRRLVIEDSVLTGALAVVTGVFIVLFAAFIGYIGVQLLRGRISFK